MKLAILRWVMYVLAMLVVGPLCAAMVSPLRLPDGAEYATILTANSPVAGLLAAIGVLGLALATGVLTARLVGSVRAGMIASGLALIWPAYQMATVDAVLRSARGVEPLWVLAAEGLVLGLLGVITVAMLVVFGGAGATGDDPHEHHGVQPPQGGSPLHRLLGSQVALATGAGVLAGAVAAFLIAATPLKGQALGGAIVGAIAAAVAARLVDLRAPLPGLMLPVLILAVAGPISGIFLSGSLAAVYGGTIVPLANIGPFDWLVGGFLGVPLGAGWAGSMVEKKSASGSTSGTAAVRAGRA